MPCVSGFRSLILEEATLVIGFDTSDDFFGCNHVHTAGEVLHDVDTDVLGFVFVAAVVEGADAGFPAAVLGAAGEGSEGMDKLVIGVGFPMEGFAATCNHYTGPNLGTVEGGRDGCREVHGGGHGGKYPHGVVDEVDEATEVCLAYEVDDTLKGWMVMAPAADLHKLDAVAEVVDDLLEAGGCPPLGSEVIFPPCIDNPVGEIGAG